MKQTSIFFLVAFLFKTSQSCAADFLVKAYERADANTDSCLAGPGPGNNITAVKNARVFDGYQFSGPRNVILIGNKIATVGGAVPPGVKIIDGTGKFLIPGLIDSHVHPSNCQALTDLAGYGITTAINMACMDYKSCASLKKQSGVADYITAGLFAVGPNSTHAKVFAVPPGNTLFPGANLAENVDWVFGNGSDFYKIVAEDQGPTQDQQNQIVQLVHGHNSFTCTHAALLAYYDQAIKSKADGIQHTPVDGLLSSAQISQIKSQGQFVTPTMELYRIAFSSPTLAALFGFDSSSSYSNVQANVAAMRKANIPISVGTDSVGSIPGLLNYPFGRSLHCELQNLVDAGFSAAEAIHAATAVAARLYGLKDRGSIATGMRADLILLNSDPVSNIINTLDVHTVWAGGIQVPTIEAMSGQSCDPNYVD